jgi:hypothetical protein
LEVPVLQASGRKITYPINGTNIQELKNNKGIRNHGGNG